MFDEERAGNYRVTAGTLPIEDALIVNIYKYERGEEGYDSLVWQNGEWKTIIPNEAHPPSFKFSGLLGRAVEDAFAERLGLDRLREERDTLRAERDTLRQSVEPALARAENRIDKLLRILENPPVSRY